MLLQEEQKKVSRESPSHFFFHKDRIEQEVAKSILSLGEKNKLRDACEYALTNGGKRFRPLIVILVAEALGHGLNVYESALSVEFFHTASLIADDLPCMDNDDERRAKPSLHKVYGESIALLSSYALITAGFEKIYNNSMIMQQAPSPFCHFSDRACCIALESATRCSGILGATGGQFLDLFPPSYTLDTVKDVIYKKTVTLFEVSFLFGWVFGGGDLSKVDRLKKAAYHFGLSFQVADDLSDLVQDEKKQREISFARLIGKERAFVFFEEEMRLFRQEMQTLGIFNASFEKMCNLLYKHATDAMKD